MPIALHDVHPAVVIEIGERHAPPKEARNLAESRLKCLILELSATQISVKARGVAREVRLHEIKVAIAIVVRDRHPHTRLRLSIRRIGNPRLDRDLLKCAVVIIPIQRR